jgi:predicted RNase H-like HicB family nuclease
VKVSAEGYLVVVARGETSWGAWAPDLPGCVAVGESAEETIELMRGAVTMHLESMREAGESVPLPTSHAVYIAA